MEQVLATRADLGQEGGAARNTAKGHSGPQRVGSKLLAFPISGPGVEDGLNPDSFGS